MRKNSRSPVVRGTGDGNAILSLVTPGEEIASVSTEMLRTT